MNQASELIFVYNADSGKWNGYLDIAHKIFSPGTYPCNLCAITYGTFSIKEDWAAFKKTLSIPTTFLHKDEWEQQYDFKAQLPAVFLRKEGEISVWIDAQTMDNLDLEGLKNLIEGKLRNKE